MYIFSDQVSQFGYILEGFGMENVATLWGHLEYITAIWWYISKLVFFPRFGLLYPEKSGNPDA
jgi:hypothetical protein